MDLHESLQLAQKCPPWLPSQAVLQRKSMLSLNELQSLCSNQKEEEEISKTNHF
jgi:hypothetical protein